MCRQGRIMKREIGRRLRCAADSRPFRSGWRRTFCICQASQPTTAIEHSLQVATTYASSEILIYNDQIFLLEFANHIRNHTALSCHQPQILGLPINIEPPWSLLPGNLMIKMRCEIIDNVSIYFTRGWMNGPTISQTWFVQSQCTNSPQIKDFLNWETQNSWLIGLLYCMLRFC